MTYLYVIETPDYSKLGKTIDYMRRLKDYARVLRMPINYTYLWECTSGSVDRIESDAKLKAQDLYEGITCERFITEPKNLASLIVDASAHHDAKIIPIDINWQAVKVKKRKKSGRIARKKITLSLPLDWHDNISKWLEFKRPKISIEEWCEKVVLEKIQQECRNMWDMPFDIFCDVLDYSRKFSPPLGDENVLADAVRFYLDHNKHLTKEQRPDLPNHKSYSRQTSLMNGDD
jgi:hypothetical protein